MLLITSWILTFILLTIIVHEKLSTSFDEYILTWFHSIESKFLDSFFSFITWLGSLWVLLPTLVGITVMLLLYGYRMPAIVFNIGFIGAVVTTHILKFLLERTRPEFFEILGSMPHDSSYPSAHTTQAFAFAFMLSIVFYMFNTSFKIPLVLTFVSLAFMVGASRMYLQVHFPSDVIAGILVALIWASIIIYFIKLGVLHEK